MKDDFAAPKAPDAERLGDRDQRRLRDPGKQRAPLERLKRKLRIGRLAPPSTACPEPSVSGIVRPESATGNVGGAPPGVAPLSERCRLRDTMPVTWPLDVPHTDGRTWRANRRLDHAASGEQEMAMAEKKKRLGKQPERVDEPQPLDKDPAGDAEGHSFITDPELARVMARDRERDLQRNWRTEARRPFLRRGR